jgi:F-type H+-transporting ATPase subunit b
VPKWLVVHAVVVLFIKEGGILKKFKTVGLVTAVLVFCAVAAFASGGEEGGHNKLLDLAYRFINFGIVGFLIYKLAGKRLADFLSGRSKQIETDLSDLDGRRESAEQKLIEVEASIANLEAEKAKILADAQAQGEALKQAIVEKAEAQAVQIKAQAEIAAAQEAKLAVDMIREELAEKIVNAAEDLVKKQLKKKDHEDLVNEYLKKVVLN